jgi:hypothetical protein
MLCRASLFARSPHSVTRREPTSPRNRKSVNSNQKELVSELLSLFSTQPKFLASCRVCDSKMCQDPAPFSSFDGRNLDTKLLVCPRCYAEEVTLDGNEIERTYLLENQPCGRSSLGRHNRHLDSGQHGINSRFVGNSGGNHQRRASANCANHRSIGH